MRRVVVESPYAGDTEGNVRYAKRAILDCLRRNEAPIASHLLFTQPNILDDSRYEERKLGVAAGHAWIFVADALVVYTDRGVSPGMKSAIKVAEDLGKPIEYRRLYGEANSSEDSRAA